MKRLKIGDRVKIVNYGGIGWVRKDLVSPSDVLIDGGGFGDYIAVDISPELVGTKWYVGEISDDEYSLSKSRYGDGNVIAWFNRDQLKIIKHK
jgi:hypothetical protein